MVQLHASVLSEDALSLAQEGDTAAVSYAICHVPIMVDPAAAAAASSTAAAAAQAAAAAPRRARPAQAAAAAAAVAQARSGAPPGSAGYAPSPPRVAGRSGGPAVGAGGNLPPPSPMEVDAPAVVAAGSAAANGTAARKPSPAAPKTAAEQVCTTPIPSPLLLPSCGCITPHGNSSHVPLSLLLLLPRQVFGGVVAFSWPDSEMPVNSTPKRVEFFLVARDRYV